MFLTSEQNTLLRRFIKRYSYPCVTYDFTRRRECAQRNMRIVESVIHRQSDFVAIDTVKDGLSNVLDWGHARAGYRGIRVCKFRKASRQHNWRISLHYSASNILSVHPIFDDVI